jgi:tetratricopeptide (TPR) repeat protein
LQCMAGVIPSFMIERNDPAFGFCERALQMDERNAIALTFLSLKHITPVLQMQSADRQTDIQQAEGFAARALAADRNFYWAHLASAAVLISQTRHEDAIVELKQTLVLNPGFTTAYTLLCEANNIWDGQIGALSTRRKRSASVLAIRFWGGCMGRRRGLSSCSNRTIWRSIGCVGR